MVEKSRGIQRVLVVGSPAAGKSEVAQRLGTVLRLPVHHLDALYYRPGWVLQNELNWERKVAELIAEDQWVIDGNFPDSLPLRAARADAVIWLDYDRAETMSRVLRRMIFPQPMPRVDLAEGCVESWSVDYLIFAWNFWEKERKDFDRLAAANAQRQPWVRVSRPKDLNFFLKRFAERVKKQ
jgi:adenylate kinase family enzyme